jgi:endo-1,4-beta-xylanase
VLFTKRIITDTERNRPESGIYRIDSPLKLIAGILTICVSAFYMLALNAQTITSNQTGTHDGYFYSFWSDGGGGSVTMTLGPAGNYSVQWSEVNNFFVGKGWETGGRRAVHYTLNAFEPGVNSYVGVFGWTSDPYIEYYIIDNWSEWRPNGGAVLGTVTTDGGTYDISKRTVSKPDQYYEVYWSVRQEKRTSGTITTGNHFDAWAAQGMDLGEFGYMILATEGYQSTGYSNVTVSGEGGNLCEVCNWYGYILPLCENRNHGWGWENGQTCVGSSSCEAVGGASVEEVECQ